MHIRIKQIAKKIVVSPTLTTWGMQGVQIAQLLILAPLLLKTYDRVEIAAWYLFASFNVFGQIILQRVNLTFSRMIAFALSGATDLSPIQSIRGRRLGGEPNWPIIGSLLATMTRLQLLLVWIGSAVAGILAYHGLTGISENYKNASEIWMAFTTYQIFAFIQFFLQRHGATLTGLNKVALNNRRGICFAGLSIVLGSAQILLDAPLYVLVFTVQSALVLNGLVASRMVQIELKDKIARTSYHFDRKILIWAWSPTWRGVVGQVAGFGLLPFLSVIVARVSSVETAGSFAFCIRLVAMLDNASMAPYNSQLPLIARLVSSGDLIKVRQIIYTRIGMASGLLVTGLCVVGVLLKPALTFIDAKIPPPDAALWFTLAAYCLINRFFSICQSVCAVANNIILCRENVILAATSMVIMWVTVGRFGVVFAVGMLIFLQVLILGAKPISFASIQIDDSWWRLLRKLGPALLLPAAACGVVAAAFL